jgi:hypothetical protein
MQRTKTLRSVEMIRYRWLTALSAAFVMGAALLFATVPAEAQPDPLPSWNDGPAKKAIVDFVKDTTTQGSPKFVPPEERIATFDQDGTLWVSHPMYSQAVYGIPPEQVIGTAGGTSYGYAKDGKRFLTRAPKLLLNDNNAGKPEGIHLMIGSRPNAAFGHSTGDMQMLQWTKAGDGARLSMTVLYDDAKREYAYGPAQGLPDTKVGTITQALYDQAKQEGWTVSSTKDDWKEVFAFD